MVEQSLHDENSKVWLVAEKVDEFERKHSFDNQLSFFFFAYASKYITTCCICAYRNMYTETETNRTFKKFMKENTKTQIIWRKSSYPNFDCKLTSMWDWSWACFICEGFWEGFLTIFSDLSVPVAVSKGVEDDAIPAFGFSISSRCCWIWSESFNLSLLYLWDLRKHLNMIRVTVLRHFNFLMLSWIWWLVLKTVLEREFFFGGGTYVVSGNGSIEGNLIMEPLQQCYDGPVPKMAYS